MQTTPKKGRARKAKKASTPATRTASQDAAALATLDPYESEIERLKREIAQVETQLSSSASGRKKKPKKWSVKRDYTRTRQRTESLYKDGVHKQQRKIQAEKYQTSHDVRRAASLGLLDSCTSSSITDVVAAPVSHRANGGEVINKHVFNRGVGDKGLLITRTKTAPFSPGILKTKKAKELYRRVRPSGKNVYTTLYDNAKDKKATILKGEFLFIYLPLHFVRILLTI